MTAALKTLLFIFCLASLTQACGQKRVLFRGDFSKPLSDEEWVVECGPGDSNRVKTQNGILTIDTKDGVTIWLRKKLEGNFEIEYTREVKVDGGPNDRLSDLNQFWLAGTRDDSPFFVQRSGRFDEYDRLRLYYVGMGGHDNTKTRFRRYDGKGGKPIIKEFSDKKHLLQANKPYNIRIVVRDGTSSFYVDDELYFSFRDPEAFKEGYFGFRSIDSRQTITEFVVYADP